MAIAGIGPTKPDAGVLATSPATAPLAAPRTVGLPLELHSTNIQARAAAAVARWVTTKALVASLLAAVALPALKPNQPNQSSAAPVTVIVRLWGGIGSPGWPRRRPMIRAAARAEMPELIWTAVPPAKSSAPIVRSHPPIPQTQCASGS